MLRRICELHHTVTAYDATNIAVAESLGCPLLTADARLSRSPGPMCSITLITD